MQRKLCLDTLGEMDNGNARAIIDAALHKAAEDLDDRGGEDGKARVVTITVSLKKIDGGLVGVNVEASAKVPAYSTSGTACRSKVINGRSTLLFQQLSPDNPDQRTLDELSPGELPSI